jgi:extracellular elastinolytic metalloproteinase
MSYQALSQRAAIALLTVTAALASASATAIMQLHDHHSAEIETDYRPGRLLPGSEQLARVAALKARANWNRFGTVHSLIRHGGYLGSGYGGSPAEGARAWILDNRVLFKLSPQGVADLEVVNEGAMPYTEARAVLFRQRFGGLKVTHDGLITVGIVGGKVYYVSSSSAGDQPPAGAAVLTPLQAWMKAAADVNRLVAAPDVLLARDATAQSGWHLFDVVGFSQTQRARLVAIPIPAGGVRQAYETIVVDMQDSGATLAYVHFIDAETGAVLRRENRLQNFAGGVPAQVVSGALATGASCSVRHDLQLDQAAPSFQLSAASVIPTNAFVVNVYRDGARIGSEAFKGSGTLSHAPQGGVAAGTYQVEICPQNTAGNAFLPPYNYVASFGPGGPQAKVVYNTAQWRWFPDAPSLDYSSTDTRKIACFGADQTGCDHDVTSFAARQPWDMLFGAVPTFTSIGNAAITQQSPYTAAIAGAPFAHVMTPSPTRVYDYPWTNAWATSGCSPVNSIGATAPVGIINDIDATIANLFVAHNRMHNWSYMLGFTELNYNLQVSNFGITDVDVQNDPELGMAQAAGPIGGWPAYLGRDNANQATFQDGVPGITQQYLFQPIGGVFYAPCNDGSFDMSIIGHEYGHAITNRMIGGPDQGIGSHQGGAMGESWGDLMASEYLFGYGYLAGGLESTIATAAYAFGAPNNGVRNYAKGNNPLNYGNAGYDTPGPQVHADGEIWTGTNWSLRQALVDKYEAQYPYTDMDRQRRCADGAIGPEGCPGNRRWIQIMFDSFLLMPASPSMLDARDAMLAADMARFGGANQVEMWRVFASRGMGISAITFDGSDQAPIPAFDTPIEDNEALITFSATDEAGAPIGNARLYIGQYATRTRAVADTHPKTIEPETFEIVPGNYDLMVEAPGFGIHRFNRTFESGPGTFSVALPANLASLAQGAVASSSATLPENAGAADNVIDESEDTGAVIGDQGRVAGAHLTVKLAGGEQTVSRVHVSGAAGPNNPGRFTPIRSFEVRVCSGSCEDPENDFGTVAYVSADDAFPSARGRPLQRTIHLRSFDFPPVQATHVQLRVLANQCTGAPDYAGEQDTDPLNPTDCATSPAPPNILGLQPQTIVFPAPGPGSLVRATEFQVFSAAPVDTTPTASKGVAAARFGGALPVLALLVLVAGAGWRRRCRY